MIWANLYRAICGHRFFVPALGSSLVALVGLGLWTNDAGEAWINASYDSLFRFGSPASTSAGFTNGIVLLSLDTETWNRFQVERGKPIRGRHARVLEKLADSGSALVVMDTFFGDRKEGQPEEDAALAKALKRQPRVVLMADQKVAALREADAVEPRLPSAFFLEAARTNWGVGWFNASPRRVARKHWPFPSPGPHPSLAWRAAELMGARLSPTPEERWLRYYGAIGPWTRLSYHLALDQPPGFYRDKIVFIGAEPANLEVDGETDKFQTPYYSGWDAKSPGGMVGGIDLHATLFLNLMNGDWLRRASTWLEGCLLITSGMGLVIGLGRLRPAPALLVGSGVFLGLMLGAASLSYCTNYWFPWLIIAGGQLPCALGWSVLAPRIRQPPPLTDQPIPPASKTIVLKFPDAPPVAALDCPDTPDYELFQPPVGSGAFGTVWLARNAIGQWQAVKAVYQAKFGDPARFGNHQSPYDREFNGIQRYKPVSEKHPGLLRVDFVSRKKHEGYFYYVMELGDALEPGWQSDPKTYKARDLAGECARAEGRRLPLRECLRIGLVLVEALEFLHRNGLTHRDIKPQNIVFVNGQPKLADVGLVSEIRPVDQAGTWVGTPGYMPSPPEPPGTVQADIYGLGMVLYVICTGKSPNFFPQISSTLLGGEPGADFSPYNKVILKACQPDCAQRYASAQELREALLAVQTALDQAATSPLP